MIGLMTSALQRFGRRDIAIATVFSVLGMVLMYGNVRDPEDGAVIHVGNLLPLEFAIPLFLLVTVPLLWRRVAPLAAAGAAFAGLLVNQALLGTELIRCGVAMPTAALLAYTAGAQLELREARAGLALTLGLVTVDYVVGFGPVVAAVFGAVIVAVWSVGRIARSRRLLADELEERNTELREARDERARLEVATIGRASRASSTNCSSAASAGAAGRRGRAPERRSDGHREARRHRARQPPNARGDAGGRRRLAPRHRGCPDRSSAHPDASRSVAGRRQGRGCAARRGRKPARAPRCSRAVGLPGRKASARRTPRRPRRRGAGPLR